MLRVQTGVIKESLRITALVTSRLPLISPHEHLQYHDWNIPPNVGLPVDLCNRGSTVE